MTIHKPPKKVFFTKKDNSVFLAGSIEMGKAEDWQTRFTAMVADIPNIVVLNPRRDDWDNSWKQSMKNKKFVEQVEWELHGLENADCVVVNFCADTQSPITLLELGLLARTSQCVFVHCPAGYWKKGNVEVVARKYGLQMVKSLEDAAEKVKAYFS